MIFLAACYGLLTYWLTHHWQSVLFADDLFGYRYRDLPILALSMAPWLAAYFLLRNRLPGLSRLTRSLLGIASSLLILGIAYHAYYFGHAGSSGHDPRLIDHLDSLLRLISAFAKPFVIFACIVYPVFSTIRWRNEKRSKRAA